MAKLNDKSRKKMIADRANGMTQSQLAEKYNVSTTTVKNTLKKCPDEVSKKLLQKKEQNTADILSYMDEQAGKVCTIINLGLDALMDPEKFAYAQPTQITTALGTLIDKWTHRAEAKAAALERADDPLTISLREVMRNVVEQEANGNTEIPTLPTVQGTDL